MSELGDINALILDVLDSPRKAQWHWPSYYLLYVDLDRLDNLLARVKYVFELSFGALGEPQTVAERVADDNALFALLDNQQKAVINGLFQMYRYTGPNPADPAAHKRLGAHVHPKSGWYQTFMDEYRSGVVAADSNTLRRVALPIDQAATGVRIDNIAAGCMLRRQVFDTSTRDGKSALAHATGEVRKQIGKVLDPMKAFLAAHCTVPDLLHPFSR